MFELFSYGDAGWGDEILRGLAITVQLAIVTLPVGLFLGFLAAFASMSKFAPLRYLGFGYTTVMRGLPEILTLFVVYNGVGLLMNAVLRWWNPEAPPTDFSPFAAGVVALGMVFGAFAGEVLRGAFQSLDKGQVEAGRAIGMTERQIFRRIQLPQLWRFALPPCPPRDAASTGPTWLPNAHHCRMRSTTNGPAIPSTCLRIPRWPTGACIHPHRPTKRR